MEADAAALSGFCFFYAAVATTTEDPVVLVETIAACGSSCFCSAATAMTDCSALAADAAANST